MGFKEGGKFYPHRTHQNGLSADFITPVFELKNNQKIRRQLPTNALQLWGYRVRLDQDGKYQQYEIDTDALIAHLSALDQAGKKHRSRIKRVILDPQLVVKLKQNPNFHKARHLNFMQTKAWFPHDGHYHVDFH